MGEEIVTLPTSSWEIEDIERHLQEILAPKSIVLSVKHNNNTLRSTVKCNHLIDFQPLLLEDC